MKAARSLLTLAPGVVPAGYLLQLRANLTSGDWVNVPAPASQISADNGQ